MRGTTHDGGDGNTAYDALEYALRDEHERIARIEERNT